MALNVKNPLGRRVAVKIAADVASGAITRSGSIVGIPVEHTLNGNTVAFVQEGLVALTLNMGGTLAAGCFLYWNRGATPTADALSLGAAIGDFEVAQILNADPSAATLYLCRMNIGFPRCTAGGANAQ